MSAGKARVELTYLAGYVPGKGDTVQSSAIRGLEALDELEAERDQLRDRVEQLEAEIEDEHYGRTSRRYRAALEKAEEHMRYGRPTQAVIVITRALDPTEAPS